MCQYLSFVVEKKTHIIHCAHFLSHNRTIKILKLLPDSYYECEWIKEEPKSLVVRMEPKDSEIEAEVKATVWSAYKTRTDMFNALLSSVIDAQLKYDWDLELHGCTSLKSLPENLRVGGNLYLHGCASLKSLPENLRVGGNLYLPGCTSLKSLPENLRVGGNLYLNGCKSLTSLPENIRENVKGEIYR